MIPDVKLYELFYSPVYDYKYYRAQNPDLITIFGNRRGKYLKHFIRNGMQEGRIASPTFDVSVYKKENFDLFQTFGNNIKKYYMHYLICGYMEKRKTF